MSRDGSFKAIVNLNNAPGEIEHLKRLALIFDEIYYIYPQLCCLEDLPPDKAIGFQFDLFRDCVLYDVITLEHLKETLCRLEEAKIAKGISATDETLEESWRDMAIIDEKDSVAKLTPSSPGSAVRFAVEYASGPEKGRKTELVAVNPSVVIWDFLSDSIREILRARNDLITVSLGKRQKKDITSGQDVVRQIRGTNVD